MLLDFHADETHDHFQFLWIALTRARLPAISPGRIAILAGLVERLASLSSEKEGGGRVLIEPCELLVTEAEHALILEAIATVSWRPVVRDQVQGLVQFLAKDGRLVIPA